MKKILILLAGLVIGHISGFAQLMYKIEGNGLKEPSYIFGTHHLVNLSVLDGIKGYHQAFDSTKQIVGEIDMTTDRMALGMKMQPYMMANADSTLSKVIAPDDFARINVEFKKYAPIPGMDLSMLEPMKPMVVSTMVSVGIIKDKLKDFNENEQLDTYFQETGVKEGKKIVALETPEQQAQILYCTTPIAEQAKNLIEMLDKPEELVEVSEKLNNSYINHNLQDLYNLSRDSDSNPEFMVKLLDNRNADWLTKLPAIMSEAPSFIAVGALHLPGENGVLEGLKKAGYTVTPVE